MLRSNRGSIARPGSSRNCSSRPAPYRVTGRHHHHVQQQSQAHQPLPDQQYTTHSLCQICQLPHKHFSSLRLRDMLGVEGPDKRYLCPSCKSHHRSYPEERIKLVVSDSTLHQFFAPPGYTAAQYPGDIMHSDYITIPGGCLDDLYNAFRFDCDLLPTSKPLDCVLVMGYNDVVKGHSRHFMMDCYQLFTKAVLDHGKEQHPDTPNTISIATLMYPSQLA